MTAADQGNVRARGLPAHAQSHPVYRAGKQDARTTSQREDNHHPDPVGSAKQKGPWQHLAGPPASSLLGCPSLPSPNPIPHQKIPRTHPVGDPEAEVPPVTVKSDLTPPAPSSALFLVCYTPLTLPSGIEGLTFCLHRRRSVNHPLLCPHSPLTLQSCTLEPKGWPLPGATQKAGCGVKPFESPQASAASHRRHRQPVEACELFTSSCSLQPLGP